MQAPGELRSNLTKLAAGARAVTSAWGGVQGPRPAAAGGSRLYHRLGARPLRPVPPRRPPPGGGGAATPPRPAPPQRDSPGVPAPRPWPLSDSRQGSAHPPPHGLCRGWGWQCWGGGQREEGSGSGPSVHPQLPAPAMGRPDDLGPYRNHWGSLLAVQDPGPPPGRFSSPGRGSGICDLNKCPVTLVQSSRAPLPETLLCRDGELVLEGGLGGGRGWGTGHDAGSVHWGVLDILFLHHSFTHHILG